jgi:hypothetical protein
MELKTTLVKLKIPKSQMLKSTDNAFLIDLKDDKVWIPKKKMNVIPLDNEDFNEVTMPRWVFIKTNLPLYFEATEFDHVTEV